VFLLLHSYCEAERIIDANACFRESIRLPHADALWAAVLQANAISLAPGARTECSTPATVRNACSGPRRYRRAGVGHDAAMRCGVQ